MGLKFWFLGSALLAATLVNAQTKVACVGNSITEGYGLNWDDKKYPDHLQTLLNANSTQENQFVVTNLGNSGKMFHKVSNESYWKETTFSQAYNLKADIVIIELGTNDSKYFFDGKGSSSGYNFRYGQATKEELIKDYEALIDTFAHQPQAPTIYATLQPYAESVEWGIVDTAIVNQINPIIKEAAISRGVNLIDLHTLFNKREWLLDDVVHPNAVGAQELASVIHKFVQPGNSGNIIQNKNVLTTFSETDECNWYKEGELLKGENKCSLTITQTGTYKVSAKIYKTQDSRIVSELKVVDLDADGNSASTSSSNTIVPPTSSSSNAIIQDSSELEALYRTSIATFRYSIAEKSIIVENYTGEISVFDLNGNLIKRVSSNGSAQIQMNQAGAYIIKTGFQTKKLFLK